MKKNKIQIKAPKKQQGMVLVVALIMLLLITILGVSAVNRSGISTQVSGNSMYSMLVYQGVESAIARSATGSAQMNIKSASKISPTPFPVPAGILPDETVTGGSKMKSKGTVTAIAGGPFPCPIVSGSASSTTISCYVYEVDANTKLTSTGAKARHIEARSTLAPVKAH